MPCRRPSPVTYASVTLSVLLAHQRCLLPRVSSTSVRRRLGRTARRRHERRRSRSRTSRWGIYDILSDHQVRAGDGSEWQYFRTARKVLSPSGVQNASEL